MGEWMYRSTYPWRILVWGEGSVSNSGHFNFRGRNLGAQFIGGWASPRTCVDDLERSPYQDSNSDPSAVQPIAIRYTDCSFPAVDNGDINNRMIILDDLKGPHSHEASCAVCELQKHWYGKCCSRIEPVQLVSRAIKRKKKIQIAMRAALKVVLPRIFTCVWILNSRALRFRGRAEFEQACRYVVSERSLRWRHTLSKQPPWSISLYVQRDLP
jgi:hypothetical protein